MVSTVPENLEQTPKKQEKNEKKSVWKKRLLIGCLFLCLGVAAYFLWLFLQREAQGVIRVVESSHTERTQKNTEKRLYEGKYFDFSHTSDYQEKGHELPVTLPILESVSLSSSKIEGRKIALVIADRDTIDFSSDPSYQIRRTDREYEVRSFEESGFRGEIFTRDQAPFETTAFFRSEGYIVSLSLTSPFSREGMESDLLSILASLHFHFGESY